MAMQQSSFKVTDGNKENGTNLLLSLSYRSTRRDTAPLAYCTLKVIHGVVLSKILRANGKWIWNVN
jgi:hypothetical protein